MCRRRSVWASVVAAVSAVLVLPAVGSAQTDGDEPVAVFVDGVSEASVDVEAPWISATITVEISAGTATTVIDAVFPQDIPYGDDSCAWIGHSQYVGLDEDLSDGVIDPPEMTQTVAVDWSDFTGACEVPEVVAAIEQTRETFLALEGRVVPGFFEIFAQDDGSGTGDWGGFPFRFDDIAVPGEPPAIVEEDFAGEGDVEDEADEGEAIGDCFPDDQERKVVGVVVATSGMVEIQRDPFGDFVPVAEGGSVDVEADLGLVTRDSFLIHHGDVVRTAPGSLARIVSFEEPISLAALDESRGTPLSQLGGTRPTDWDIMGNTDLCLSGAIQTRADLTPDTTIWEVLKGALSLRTNGWVGTSGLFSVRAGTTIAGSRNTEYIVSYDPDRGESTVLVREGDVAVVSDDAERIVGPGTVLVTRDGVGEVGLPTAMSDAQWDAVVNAADPLEAIDALLNSSAPAVGDEQNDNNSILIITIVAAALAALVVVAVFVVRGRSKSASAGT